jgi:chromosome partitioning protein
MNITVASYKGGVGKTTTAVHIAAVLNKLAPTLLLDGDQTRNAINWSQRGAGFPFRVASISQAVKLAPEYAEKGHIVIDTGQRPTGDDLRDLVDSCDWLIIPTPAYALEADGLMQTIQALQEVNAGDHYRVLLTRVAPPPEKDAAELRKLLTEAGVPLFKAEIPNLKAFAKAAAAGEIVSQTKDRLAARAWDAYAAAGKELTK